jgi:cellulose synthase/poly-beta-1,6-N-acetylglucosamine synthase-like glycosyltransferase
MQISKLETNFNHLGQRIEMPLKFIFLVFARNSEFVATKIKELDALNVTYIIVCGENFNHPNVFYQSPTGKYEAVNFGMGLLPKDVDIVVMNDVDTKIVNFEIALHYFEDPGVALVFGTEVVNKGPQVVFNKIINNMKKRIQIVSGGELMLIRRTILDRILPLKPCKAEDTYILFKVSELGYRTIFCEQARAETERTVTADREVAYKRRTVTGIYQALSMSKPPYLTRLFYVLLPFACPLLLFSGTKGYFATKGILLGLIDFLRGEKGGKW